MASPVSRLGRLISRTAAILCLLAVSGAAAPVPVAPATFVLSWAAGHDVLLLGTRHRQPRILGFVTDLLPALRAAGVTHVGLEIGADQQPDLDRYLSGRDTALPALYPQIDCAAYRRLLGALRRTGLPALALDRPATLPSGSRDHFMARRIAALFERQPDARLLVVVGNLHTLKAVRWLSPAVRDTVIRPALARLQPRLRVCSIAQWNGIDPLAPSGPRPAALATRALKQVPAFLAAAAIESLGADAAVDGLILY